MSWLTRLNRLAHLHRGAGTVAELMDTPIPMLESMEKELAELLKVSNG